MLPLRREYSEEYRKIAAAKTDIGAMRAAKEALESGADWRYVRYYLSERIPEYRPKDVFTPSWGALRMLPRLHYHIHNEPASLAPHEKFLRIYRALRLDLMNGHDNLTLDVERAVEQKFKDNGLTYEVLRFIILHAFVVEQIETQQQIITQSPHYLLGYVLRNKDKYYERQTLIEKLRKEEEFNSVRNEYLRRKYARLANGDFSGQSGAK